MVDNINEGLETDAALSNISVEKSDSDYDVTQLAKLCYLFGSSQTNKWS